MGLRIPSIRSCGLLAPLLAAAAALVAALAIGTAPAGAVIVSVKEGAETVQVGVQPRTLVEAPETPLQ